MHRFAFPTAVCLAFLLLASSSAALADWPGFRGPDSTGAATSAALFKDDGAGLAVGWKVALGSGYSSLAVADGRVVAMFAAGEHDAVAAFDQATGDELWRYEIAEAYNGHDGSHDGPISTPLIADGRVYGLGAWGHLFAVDAATGKPVWAKHIVDDLGAKKPHYGFTSSPLMSDGVLVVEIGNPEGKAIAGFDPATGELKWTVGDDGVEYHSPIVGTVGGRSQVIAAGSAKLFGIDASSGEVLWSYEHGGDPRAMGGATIVPLPAGEGRFFLMNKQDTSSMLEVSRGGDDLYEVRELWNNNAIKSSYVSPVYYKGHIYGISGRVLTCVDATTGERKWRSREPGDGFLTVVGDKLVVMTKPGSLHVANLSPDGYQEVARLDLFEEHSWSEVAISGGHLFARSMNQLARIDVVAGADTGDAKLWVADTAFGRFLADVEKASDKTVAVDAFIKSQRSFPIVEGSDVAHFVHRGEATDVGIVGDMIGFRREDPMTRVPGTDLFYYSTRLEPDAAVTYGFIVDFEDPAADSLNADAADGLFGEVSWLAMPAWEEPTFLGEAEKSSQGRMETVDWEREVTEEVDGEEKTTKQTRTAQVYLPAGFDAKAERRYPTVYFHAGMETLEDAAMKNTLDNLIGQTVQPLIAVFVMPPDGEEEDNVRPDPEYMGMLTGELVPLIDKRYPTIDEPGARATAGAGDAGVAALLAGIKHSDVFGRVGSQSAVLFSVPIAAMLDEAELPNLSIYLDWGTYDLRSPHEAWDMAQNNRDAWAALRDRGYRPAGGEQPEGHGWRAWSGHTDEMLAALFPLTE